MLQPQHCRSMDNAQLPLPSSVSGLLESFSSKSHLILPPKNDLESWSQADEFMQTTVTPFILSMTSVDLMNETLSSRIHDYFREHHGACECCFEDKQHQHNHKTHLHNALAKVLRKRNELQKKFCQASKHITSFKSDLVALGKAFHDIVKQYNRLRREVLK